MHLACCEIMSGMTVFGEREFAYLHGERRLGRVA